MYTCKSTNLQVRFIHNSSSRHKQMKLNFFIHKQSLDVFRRSEEVMQSALLDPNQLLFEVIALGNIAIRQ